MAQEMRYKPEDEMQLMRDLWTPSLADDPLRFVMYAFPWGQKGTPLEHFKGPRTWQKLKLIEIRDHIQANRQRKADGFDYEAFRSSVSSGRGIGKSALVSWITLWMLTTRIGSSVIVSANSEAQLRSVTWAELTKWTAMAINSHWFEISATKLMPAKWMTDLVEKDLAKGTRYWAAEGKLWSEENPDSYAGAHNFDGMMVIFDESSGIPDTIWNVAAGYFTEPVLDRYWFAFSNPRRNQGYFFETFNSKRTFWKNTMIDSRTVEGTDPGIYQQIIDEHGEDSYQARVEVKGMFPKQGDDQFIDGEMVEEAMKRKPYNESSAPTVMGVDVARFGSDKTVIAIRKGRDVLKISKNQGLDTMQVVGKTIALMQEYQPDLVIVDEGGLGAGVIDRLNEQRYKVRGVNFGSKADNPIMYANKRAEIWGEMREWLKGAHIPDDRDLKADLTAPTYKHNSNGAIMLEKKEDMRRRGAASPDAADAVAVTFSYPVAWLKGGTSIKYPNLGVI
jgi:hypothetical protein